MGGRTGADSPGRLRATGSFGFHRGDGENQPAVVLLRKFTEAEAKEWEKATAKAKAEAEARHEKEKTALTAELEKLKATRGANEKGPEPQATPQGN